MRGRWLSFAFAICVACLSASRGVASAADESRHPIMNGGATVWACMPLEGFSHSQPTFVDFFEATEEFGLNIEDWLPGRPAQIAQSRLAKFAKVTTFTQTFGPALTNVLSNVVYSHANYILDSSYQARVKPSQSQCLKKGWIWKVAQVSYRNHLGKIVLNGAILSDSALDPYDTLKDYELAGVFWHEAVNIVLKARFGNFDPSHTRLIVGIVFSDMSVEDSIAAIDQILKTPRIPILPGPSRAGSVRRQAGGSPALVRGKTFDQACVRPFAAQCQKECVDVTQELAHLKCDAAGGRRIERIASSSCQRDPVRGWWHYKGAFGCY